MRTNLLCPQSYRVFRQVFQSPMMDRHVDRYIDRVLVEEPSEEHSRPNMKGGDDVYPIYPNGHLSLRSFPHFPSPHYGTPPRGHRLYGHTRRGGGAPQPRCQTNAAIQSAEV